MNKKWNVLLLLFTLSLVQFSCVKDTIVSCHYRCLYVFVNNSGQTAQLTLSLKEHARDDEIWISETQFSVFDSTVFIDTVDLTFDDGGSCRLGVNADKDFYGIVYNITTGDSIRSGEIIPFDTTLGYFEFCSDCIYEYSDTLIIE
ncbi:MAG: hypothetical protein GXY77_11535 [Fibrobacter sp.]|nr:hypothetical protein [Fibrobacter sp.]